MVSITCYGGVNEIGGNKILIEDKKDKIFLDFGMSFGEQFKYFDAFLTPRKLNGMGDFFELGLLPRLNGIYRKDYLRWMGKKEEQLACNGVFISHAHADHIGYIHFLREDLPIYGTPETHKIIDSVEETSGTGWCEFANLKRTFEFYKNKKGGYSRLQGDEARLPRKRSTVDKPIKFDSITVKSSRVNHSVPGATGYIIETTQGSIAYTGDVRFHGYGGHMTEKFIEDAKGVDTLLIEGTRIDGANTLYEEDVCDLLNKEISRTEGIVLANWPARDTDRLISFYNAAKESGRILVLNTKQANLLEKLNEVNKDVPKITDKNIRIFLTRKSWGLIDRKDLPDEKLKLGDYEAWERPYLDHPNMVDYNELHKNPEDYVVRTDFFDMSELIDLKPDSKAKFIPSTCEPFDDKMEFNDEIINAWLNHFGIKRCGTIHCSGHAPGPDIERIIEEIKPRKLIPIHTTNAKKFEELCKNCAVPTYGKAIGL